MKTLGFSTSWKTRIAETLKTYSPFEKALLWFFIVLLSASTIVLFIRLNNLVLVEVPDRGGSITEGVIGSPRFINPVLAISDSDRDLSALVYSGLTKKTPSGNIVPDLAESYSISEDGRVYTFTLRNNLFFHDGEHVSVDDVIFTVNLTQHPTIKSPLRANWDGVIAQKVDERTVEFTLPQPYAPFLENTTIGVLPKHIWEGVSAEQFPFSQFNVEPIGTGPFQLDSVKRNSAGLPSQYKLTRFESYALGAPFIRSMNLRFYPNEEDLIAAYEGNEVDAINSISPERARDLEDRGSRIVTSPLPRIFGVFLNQNNTEIFTSKIIREALANTVPKDRITNEVLAGFGTIIEGPIPPGIIEDSEENSDDVSAEQSIEDVRNELLEAGWEREEDTGVLYLEDDEALTRLSFSISTSNTLELKSIASIVAEAWRELGAEIDLRFFETSDLNQNVIRPRDYDALLFGEIVGRELDLFSFWHSSQRNDPGLNIALYASITADKLLEDARANTNREERHELFKEFEIEVQEEAPAVFLYSPLFIYVVGDNVQDLELGPVTTSAERFLNVHEWYIETEKVWPPFVKNN